MSLTLNIKGAPATASAKSGLDQLKESGAEDAKGILANLRGEFEGRTGVVRLMHTSKADRFMKFSDAGGFKQMFISGTKLESTGRVIAQLMERSGDFTDKQIEDFKEYASNRGRRGIESQQLATYLTPSKQSTLAAIHAAGNGSQLLVGDVKPLKHSTYATVDEALQALGVTGHEALGSGSQGSVSKVMVHGQPFALKTLSDAKTLGLVGSDGRPVGQAPKDESRSSEPASSGHYQENAGLLLHERDNGSSVFGNPQPFNWKHSDATSSVDSQEIGKKWEAFNSGRYQYAHDKFKEDQSEVSNHSSTDEFMDRQESGKKLEPINPKLYQFILDQYKENRSEVSDHSSTDSLMDRYKPYDPTQEIARQSDQSPSEVSDDKPGISLQGGRDELHPQETLHKQPELQPQAPVNPQPSSESVKTEIKLARTVGIGSLARMKDLDQVVQPSHYLITEHSADGNSRVHVVEGNRALKDWVKTQAPDSRIEVTQYLMPLAAGMPLMTFGADDAAELRPALEKDESVESSAALSKDESVNPMAVFKKVDSAESLNFKKEDLPDIARSMASLLEKMWQHGFIDGDIKPDNLMWDPTSKTLRAIDIDSFQKMSKKGGALPERGVMTILYSHPNVFRGPQEQPTLGRDLFSAGMVMLEAALRSGGHGGEADQLQFLGRGPAKTIYLRVSKANELPETLDRMKESLNFADGGVEDFAMLCIKTSLDYENKRLAQGITRFERYDENAGQDHPMSILKRHPLMNPVE